MIENIFRAIFITSIAGSALTAVLAMLKPLTKRFFSYKWHYYIWLAVLLVMIMPIRFSMPQRNSEPVNEAAVQSVQSVKSSDDYRADAQQQTETNIVTGNTAERTAEIIKPVVNSDRNIIGYIWLFGAALFIIIDLVSYLRLIVMVRKNTSVISCAEVSEIYGAALTVRKGKGLSSPFIMGVFKPVLVLPETELSSEQLDNILRHEMTHFRRRDILYKWFAVLVSCIHWFNPFVYYVLHQINTECEISCDLSVVKDMSSEEKISYVNTIIALLSSERSKRIPLTTQMASGKAALKRRFTMIKNLKATGKAASVTSAITAAVMLVTTVFASGVIANEAGAHSAGDIAVLMNGQEVRLESNPFIDNQEVYVPLRETLNACGVADENITYNNGRIDMVIYSYVTDSSYGMHIDIGMPNITFDDDAAGEYKLVNGARTTTHPVLMREGVTYIPIGMLSRIKQYDVELADESEHVKGFRYNRALPVKLLSGLTVRLYDENGFDVMIEDWTTAESRDPSDYYEDGENVIIGNAAVQEAQGYSYGTVNGYYYPTAPVKRILTDDNGLVKAIVPVENQKHEAINGSGLSSGQWSSGWENAVYRSMGLAGHDERYASACGIFDPATAYLNMQNVNCFYIPVELIAYAE